jgi:hypothetical protein
MTGAAPCACRTHVATSGPPELSEPRQIGETLGALKQPERAA